MISTKCRFVFLLALIPAAAVAGQGIHLDASSDANAVHSFQRMVNSLDTRQKDELLAAVAQIDKAEGKNVPGDKRPPAARIKEKIAGLTAPEIIDLAHRTAEPSGTPEH